MKKKLDSKAQELYNALKDNPAEIIAWAEAEIQEYRRLIKILKNQ